jgi:hypothetical protein
VVPCTQPHLRLPEREVPRRVSFREHRPLVQLRHVLRDLVLLVVGDQAWEAAIDYRSDRWTDTPIHKCFGLVHCRSPLIAELRRDFAPLGAYRYTTYWPSCRNSLVLLRSLRVLSIYTITSIYLPYGRGSFDGRMMLSERTDTQAGRRTDGPIDPQTDRQIGRQVGRQMDE